MKNTFLAIILFSSLTFSQAVFIEDFDYPAGNNITSHGWVATALPGSNPVKIVSPGLTFSGYINSNIGNAVELKAIASAEDVKKTFTGIGEGNTVYVTYILKVSSSASFGPSNFISLTDGIFEGMSIAAVHVSGSTYSLFLQFRTNADFVYSPTLNYNTSYLIVMKYEIISGEDNDVMSLFVFSSSIPALEPATPDLTLSSAIDASGSDPSKIDGIFLQQISSGATCIIDGIRIATTWANAPLPVELTSFTANVTKYKVLLNWETATETMNHGFEVERSPDESIWEKVGFVQGNGNSNSPKHYSFEDRISAAGNLFYRLKQIDTDGTAEYSEPIEVMVAMPTMVELHQNYPNPFNPVTNISYSIPERTSVLLRVFDVTGQVVQTLVHGFQDAGVHTVSFNGDALPSGMYFLNLQTPSGMETRKIQLIK